MGQYDSTLTRVVPVLDELAARDPTGLSWLGRLLALPRRSRDQEDGLQVGKLKPITKTGWGRDEVSLAPPLDFLRWLLVNPSKLTPPKSLGSSPTTIDYRKLLLAGDAAKLDEALGLLRGPGPRVGVWHVLEGLSQPDVYIETADFIVVIEGKRKERSPTTKTEWLRGRHQMLRHMDCAWEVRNKRKVFGFFIVEGKGGKDAVDAPQRWLDAAAQTVAKPALASSLPHREGEWDDIAAGFLGVTTWQRVCKAFDIPWGSLPNRVADIR